MRIFTFTYAKARQNLAKLLKLAQTETVRIRRRDGSIFSPSAEPESKTSPFDVPGIKTRASTEDILSAVSESRSR
ncbi:prevent-host-death protein [Salinisphaera hydrothermalis]|uniref:prevent-host-death protein n=1 Tax=Salinisphaera hydrothermalis TaxID=563188 RepID=UPI003342C0B2